MNVVSWVADAPWWAYFMLCLCTFAVVMTRLVLRFRYDNNRLQFLYRIESSRIQLCRQALEKAKPEDVPAMKQVITGPDPILELRAARDPLPPASSPQDVTGRPGPRRRQ